MSRARRWLGICAVASLACGAEVAPSVVLVTLDTVRCDHLGLYGGPDELTPRLDALGASGLVHETAYTSMPTTGPAHISMLTGLPPSEHGARENGQPMDPKLRERELAERLRAAGFATAAFVTTRLLHPHATGLSGFEIHEAPRGALRPGREAVASALRWLDAEPRRPVLLWVHLYDAHAPYGSADEKRRSFPVDASLYGWVEPDRFTPSLRQQMADHYAVGIANADRALGELLDGLRDRFDDPAKPPLVIVAGDHGEALDEHLESRGYAYDHGEFLDRDVVCVPLVLRGPGVEPGRSRGAVSVTDIYRTVLVAAGLEPSPTDGRARDLRRRSATRRTVVVERRRVGRHEPVAVRAHAAAAFDGTSGVVVGADSNTPPADAPLDLWRLAVEHAGRVDATRDAAPVDPATAEALRSLGYAE